MPSSNLTQRCQVRQQWNVCSAQLDKFYAAGDANCPTNIWTCLCSWGTIWRNRECASAM